MENVKDVELSKIHSSKLNPRKVFPEETLKELADSIREKGVVQRIIVRPSKENSGTFEVVVGERRYRASKIAGKKIIPVEIRDIADDEVEELMLIENLQREDLSPLDEGEIFKELHETHKLTFIEIGSKIGKGKDYARRRYDLVNKLAPAVKRLMQPEKVGARGSFDISIARELTDLPKGEQEKLAERALSHGMTSEQVRRSKKQARDMISTLDALSPDNGFRKKMEQEYLPRKFEPDALPKLKIDILKEKKLWVGKPKFETELVPVLEKLEAFVSKYPQRTISFEWKGNAKEISQARKDFEEALEEDNLTHWVFIVKV